MNWKTLGEIIASFVDPALFSEISKRIVHDFPDIDREAYLNGINLLHKLPIEKTRALRLVVYGEEPEITYPDPPVYQIPQAEVYRYTCSIMTSDMLNGNDSADKSALIFEMKRKHGLMISPKNLMDEARETIATARRGPAPMFENIPAQTWKKLIKDDD